MACLQCNPVAVVFRCTQTNISRLLVAIVDVLGPEGRFREILTGCPPQLTLEALSEMHISFGDEGRQ